MLRFLNKPGNRLVPLEHEIGEVICRLVASYFHEELSQDYGEVGNIP
jgi:hypothetical protein